MPVHDWTRVDAGTFHDFHNTWIGLLRNALNEGVLPTGYYAMAEQHMSGYIADVLTPSKSVEPPSTPISGGVAVAEAPPKVRLKVSLSPTARALRKTLVIRHRSRNRIVALIEIVSSANKDRREHVEAFLDKIEDALAHGIHVLVVDLFPPGSHDARGLHAALWDRLGDNPNDPPAGEPLTLASYVADVPVEAYLENLAVGRVLPDMPLFLDPETYINTPMEATYQAAWRGTGEPLREVLEKPRGGTRRKRRR